MTSCQLAQWYANSRRRYRNHLDDLLCLLRSAGWQVGVSIAVCFSWSILNFFRIDGVGLLNNIAAVFQFASVRGSALSLTHARERVVGET